MLNINHVKTFVTVVQEGSLLAASKKIKISQPAVTSHIQSLEYYLGIVLFTRAGQGRDLKITPAGKMVYERSVAFIQTYEKFDRELIEELDRAQGSLSIGAGLFMSEYILPPIIAMYRGDRKDVQVSVIPADTDQIIKGVLDLSYDIGFVGYPVQNNKLTIEKWLQDTVQVIFPPDHRLSGQKTIKAKELLSDELLFCKHASGVTMLVKEKFKESGLILEKESNLEINTTLQLLNSVQSGLGISFVSKRMADKYAAAGMISTATLEDVDLDRHLYIATAKLRSLPSRMKSFLKAVRAFEQQK